MYGRGLKGLVRRLWHNDRGNFAMFTAITIPVFAAAASLAVDTTNVMSMKTRLQNAADASALATSTKLAQGELTAATANAFATEFFKGMVFEDGAVYDGFKATPVFAFTPTLDASTGRTIWNVTVDVTGVQTLTPMSRIVGRDKMNVAVRGKAASAPPTQGALSMMLVLDKSGSMDWYGTTSSAKSNGKPKKIVALKTAVTTLTDQLIQADPEEKYVRIGAVSYHEDTQYVKTDGIHQTKAVEWKPAATKTFVDSLPASGGTDSSGAMLHAFNTLTFSKSKDVEGKAHKDKNGLEPRRFILFMTDGENSKASYDTETKKTCDDAKKKDIIIYSVAFMAPTVGQNLLKYCATDASHYFDANDNEQLVKAFKTIGQKAANMMVRLTE